MWLYLIVPWAPAECKGISYLVVLDLDFSGPFHLKTVKYSLHLCV